MPLYEFNCTQCGPFTELRPMSECATPVPCPGCAGLAPRMISAPRLAVMKRSNRVAWERNEKSAHEPRSAKNQHSDHDHHSHDHKSRHRHKHVRGGRPWMLGH